MRMNTKLKFKPHLQTVISRFILPPLLYRATNDKKLFQTFNNVHLLAYYNMPSIQNAYIKFFVYVQYEYIFCVLWERIDLTRSRYRRQK
jgi:hypothetical protein